MGGEVLNGNDGERPYFVFATLPVRDIPNFG
jgi:hypothetical protein